MAWSEEDQNQVVGIIRGLDRTDQWQFPVEVRKGLRDLTRQESQLYATLRAKQRTRRIQAEQCLLLRRLPQELREELFPPEAISGRRKLTSEESCILRGLVDSGFFDED